MNTELVTDLHDTQRSASEGQGRIAASHDATSLLDAAAASSLFGAVFGIVAATAVGMRGVDRTLAVSGLGAGVLAIATVGGTGVFERLGRRFPVGRLHAVEPRRWFGATRPLVAWVVFPGIAFAVLGGVRQATEMSALRDSALSYSARAFPRVVLRGEVVSESLWRPGLPRVVARVDGVWVDGTRLASHGRVLIDLSSLADRRLLDISAAPKLGERFETEGSLVPLQTWERFPHLHLEARLRATSLIRLRSDNVALRSAGRVRELVRSVAARSLAPHEAALLRGLLLGDEAATPRWLRDDFRDAGMAHLTAVSGQNFAVLLGSVGLVLGVRTRPRRARSVAAIAIFVVVALAFGFVAGWEPSVMRACWMMVVAISARQAGIPLSPKGALLGACSLVAVFDPAVTSSVGFQLSVAAAAGLVFWAERWSSRIWEAIPGRPFGGILAPLLASAAKGVCTVAATSWAAQVAVTPVAFLLFGELRLAGLVSNLIAVPLANIASLIGYASTPLAAASPWLGAQGYSITAPLLGGLIGLARGGSRIPSLVYVQPVFLRWIVVGGGVTAVVVIRRTVGQRVGRWISDAWRVRTRLAGSGRPL